jgi:hypothetical protein
MEGSLLQLQAVLEQGHRCLEDGQVHSDNDEFRGAGQTQGTVCSNNEEQLHGEAKGMTITSLPSIPSFHTFRVRGGLQGQ